MQHNKVKILSPKYYNNKIPVEDKKFADTYREIVNHFSGYTQENTPLLGGCTDSK
ncbi:MAG: hypothetical protein M3Z01_01370 [Thermoproteota archaeon]|nr:hypothetical protein [Thermoproteota archaeon]